MKKQQAKKLLKDLQVLGMLPKNVNSVLNAEVEKHLEEKLEEKETENKKEFFRYKIDFDVKLTKRQYELSLANFTF